MRLQPNTIKQTILRQKDRIEAFGPRLERGVQRQLERRQARFDRFASSLSALSYRNVLERGYAVVRDAENKVITSAKDAARIHAIEFADGEAAVDGMQTAVASAGAMPEAQAKPAPKKAKAKKPKDDGSAQGSLF